MSATVTLEISDYYPNVFNFEGFSFNFKSEHIDEVIEFSKKNKITTFVTNLKKDRKFTVRVLKNNSLVGISEFIVPELLLIKRENKFGKIVSISMIDSVKRVLLKDINKVLQIQIKANIIYSEETWSPSNFYTDKLNKEIRSASAKPINSNSDGKSINSNLPKSVKNSNGKQIKPNYIINERGSIIIEKNMSIQTDNINNNVNYNSLVNSNSPKKNIQIDEFAEIENSFIDSIFNDNHLEDFDNVDQFLNEFNEEFNKTSNEILEENDKTILKEKAKIIIPKLFDLQKKYHHEFNLASKNNKRFKELLVKYNEKHRIIVKKTHRLREALESNNIRNELTSFINNEENKRVKDTISITNKEISIFKQLFKLDYTTQDLNDFKIKNNENKEAEDKKIMLELIGKISSASNLMKKLPDDKQIKFGYLTMKYGISIKEEEDLIVEEKSISEDNKEVSVVRKLSTVKSNLNDPTDKRLEEYLNNFYARKRFKVIIQFKRVAEGEYEYGTQKVQIKFDGDLIKVKIGGVSINFDKFLEVYAPLEEAKQIKASITEKFKDYSGPKNGIIGKIANAILSPNSPKKKK